MNPITTSGLANSDEANCEPFTVGASYCACALDRTHHEYRHAESALVLELELVRAEDETVATVGGQRRWLLTDRWIDRASQRASLMAPRGPSICVSALRRYASYASDAYTVSRIALYWSRPSELVH